MKQATILIKDIVEKKELYPRGNWDWKTSLSYSQAMKTGNKFPSIVVALLNGRYYLIDGKHRIEAYKTCKEKFVTAEVLTNLNENEIYLEAVKRNLNHGRQFSSYDKRNIIIRLQDMNYSKEIISELIQIPIERLEPFVFNSMAYNITTGQRMALKSAVRNFAQQEVTNDLELNQETINSGGSQVSILNELILLMKNNYLDLQNEKVLQRLTIIKELLSHIDLSEVKTNETN